MPRRSVKTRRPRVVDLAGAMTMFWLACAILWHSSGGKGNTGSYLALFTVLAIGSWVWVIYRIRQNQSAGKSLSQLRALSPDEFEDWVGARLREQGYSVRTTASGADHGLDLIAEKLGEVLAVQCKRYSSKPVGEPVLRDLLGTMQHYGANRGLLATTSQLTPQALDWVRDKPIEIWDSEKLVSMYGPPSPAKIEGQAGQASALKGVPAAAVCPRCGGLLVDRTARESGNRFIGCSHFPECRYTRPA